MYAAPLSRFNGSGSIGKAEASQDQVGRTLGQICRRLDVAAATLRIVGQEQLAGRFGSLQGIARQSSFCRQALSANRVLSVADASKDARFAASPLVTGAPFIRFYVGMPFTLRSGQRGILSLFDTRARSVPAAQQLAALTADIAAGVAMQPAPGDLDRLKAELAHSRKLFDRACATARIGVWECDLNDQGLTWTDGVYDIFELPRGSPIDRAQTLEFYDPASRTLLQEQRSHAIAICGSFSLDAQITTVRGNRRWMRVTATVEHDNGVATRLFGMKQDITEEKLLADRTRYLAEFDVMTGLANRAVFQARLAGPDGMQSRVAAPAALLLVDLDGFKQINDTHGHALGDECLRQAARRLDHVCAEAQLVARVGGDEFAVLLDTGPGKPGLHELARRIVAGLSQPVLHQGLVVPMGASVGIARNTLTTPGELFKQADAALYAAKAAGRGTFRIFER